MNESRIAPNIRRIINEQGFIQASVAKRAGINPKTFSNMLNNRKLIGESEIIAISAALGVTPNDLFYDSKRHQ